MTCLCSSALEADRRVIRGSQSSKVYKADVDVVDTFASMEKIVAYYVDRRLRTQDHDRQNLRRKFRGCGRASNDRWNQRKRIPSNVCIVCHKTGCHSSKHKDFRTNVAQMFAAMGGSSSDDSLGTEDIGSEGQDDESASAYISSARAIAAV